jgi:2-amino-4-hydroxy-6-hydroxymethyldihydropteridine diphosphokinase
VSQVTAAIALGSNLGDRHGHIAFAFDALSKLPGVQLTGRSSIIETAPVGPIPQGPYLNAAGAILTTLSAADLLAQLFAIERLRGRDRASEQRWGPRTLDLDLLLYGNQLIDEDGLSVPHPRLHERLFVLEPLAQVLPGALVPGLNKTVAALLAEAKGATQASAKRLTCL